LKLRPPARLAGKAPGEALPPPPGRRAGSFAEPAKTHRRTAAVVARTRAQHSTRAGHRLSASSAALPGPDVSESRTLVYRDVI
jgi:hypothetical protein